MSNIKKISICAILVAVSFALSRIKMLEFLFPFGGSITPFSMLFLSLPAYFCGVRYGILSCLVFSILRLIFGSNIYYPMQAFIDYVLAYFFFFLTGLNFFKTRPNGFLISFIIAVLFRLLFSAISGLIFFMEYTPDGFNKILYPFIYNAMYIIPELVISIVLIKTSFFKKYILEFEIFNYLSKH